MPAIEGDETPFALPDGWQWGRFVDVATIASNLVHPKDYLDYPHVAPDNIEKFTGKLLPYRSVREDKVSSANHKFFSGQIVYSKIRPNLAKAVIVDFEGLCSADMYPINVHIFSQYLLLYMLSETFLSMAVKTDTRVAMPKINQDELNKILVPVPPLEEQKRIVAKVDELMRLCDELEARQQARRESRVRLNNATLAPLNNAASLAPEEFEQARVRLADNFASLYDSAETVGKLRSTIIQLAVQGRLVPQDPRDEPAFSLLKEVRKEKERQIREKARAMGIFRHVADRVEMDERRNRRDDDQHHRGERIDPQRPVDMEIARDNERRKHDAGFLMPKADLHEADPGQHHGGEQQDGGHELARPRTDQAPEQPRNGGAEQRQEDDRQIHRPLNPSSN